MCPQYAVSFRLLIPHPGTVQHVTVEGQEHAYWQWVLNNWSSINLIGLHRSFHFCFRRRTGGRSDLSLSDGIAQLYFYPFRTRRRQQHYLRTSLVRGLVSGEDQGPDDSLYCSRCCTYVCNYLYVLSAISLACCYWTAEPEIYLVSCCSFSPLVSCSARRSLSIKRKKYYCILVEGW
jgi:hypothetical protein